MSACRPYYYVHTVCIVSRTRHNSKAGCRFIYTRKRTANIKIAVSHVCRYVLYRAYCFPTARAIVSPNRYSIILRVYWMVKQHAPRTGTVHVPASKGSSFSERVAAHGQKLNYAWKGSRHIYSELNLNINCTRHAASGTVSVSHIQYDLNRKSIASADMAAHNVLHAYTVLPGGRGRGDQVQFSQKRFTYSVRTG